MVDYPIFEQLHYLLVADFNVYGSTGLQLASRTYMDLLRQDAEDNFLRFMPAMERENIYNSWYIGLNSWRKADPLFNVNHETQVKFKTTNHKKEFFDQLRQKMGKAAGTVDTINHCEQADCIRANTTLIQQQVDSEMRQLAKLKGHELGALVDDMLLRVKTGEPTGDLVYTLLIDKAFTNISRMIADDARRMPENDRITIYPGFIGSYPNFFFSVEKNQLGEFVNRIRNAKTATDIDQIYSKFGIRRTNPDIWQHADWFNEQHKIYRGVEAGLLDMSRYDNL
ncbi:MAG: fatty acid cis/trans isomerase [Methylococcaceae bacterium]|nr:fatty acid cis/trans isomerase [Methylococcaceae bacterium]